MPVPLGYKFSETTKENMRAAQRERFKRKPMSEEEREKMRASALARWDRDGLSEKYRQKIKEGQTLRRDKEHASQAGVSLEDYLAHKSDGFEWCNACNSFQNDFPDPNKNRCRQCYYEKNYVAHCKYYVERRASRLEAYAANINGAKDKVRDRVFKKYGIFPRWYEEKLSEQNGGCAICGKRDNGVINSFAIDHNHNCCPEKKRSCGKCVRGLLCSRCNGSLERMESIPGWAEKAVAYLRKYGTIS
jgi:hypothetical protein